MSTARFAQISVGMNVSGAVLKIDDLHLLFQQGDICALESASDVNSAAPREKSVGWINYMRQRWPVYCLSDQLHLLNSVPPARRTCALMAFETGYIGLLCDDMHIIKQATGQQHDVPLVMKNAHMPISALIPSGDKLLCASNQRLLATYLALQICNPSLPEEMSCIV